MSCLASWFDEKLAKDTQRVGTQEIRFGRQTDGIAKFNILDEKRNSLFWTKFGRTDQRDRRKKLSNSFTFTQFQFSTGITIMLLHNAFTVWLKKRMPRIIGCEWISFLSQNERIHRTAGTTL